MPSTSVGGANAGRVLRRANPGTIQDKFMVGYQGWFTCAGDGPPIGEGHHGWLHWIDQPLTAPANGRPNTDLWPDTSAYDPSELYPVPGLAHKDGAPARVFSSRDARTVNRHFRWMAEHGVDGAFLQRFVGQVDPEEAGNRDERYGGTRRLRDEVGRRVKEAAEKEGRVWAIMYDASGVPPSQILRILTQDFTHLLYDEHILSSPAYLRERGRPVVALWGFGLSDSRVDAALARACFDALRAIARQYASNTGGYGQNDGEIYIFAGTPSHWRTPGAGDAHVDPAWSALWLGQDGAVDAVSPWSVGRFSDKEEVERWAVDRWGGDADLVAAHNEEGRGRRVDYVPVVLPGGSGFNLSEGKWAFNGIKRNGGKFLWAQVFHAKRLKGVRTMYGAMWDEYDEGTAFLPVVEKKRLLPESDKWPFLALDEEGYDLPADWYMRIAGFAAEGLRSERRIHDSFPSKELQDYWSTRPHYEDEVSASSSSSSSGAGASSSSGAGAALGRGASASASYSTPTPAAAVVPEKKEEELTEAAREAKAQFDIWAEEQRRKEAEGEDMPPPAYSLEDEGPAVVEAAPVQQQPAQQQAAPVQQPAQQQQQQAPFQQPSQQQQPAHQQSPYNNAADAAVGALAGDFAARARIGASPPPLHPSHPGRQQSGGVGQQQGYGRGGGGANVGAERPPLHPMQRVGSGSGSQGSIHSVGGAGGGGEGAYGPGRIASPEQGQGQGQWGARPYQPQQAQHTGGSGSSGSGSAPYPGAYQPQHQNSGGPGTYPAQGQAQQTQGYQQQNMAGAGAGQGYQQAQHTGGSAGSGSGGVPPQALRPASTYPGQGQAASAGYAPPAGAPQGQAGYAPPAGSSQGQSGHAPPAGPPQQAGYAPPAGPPQGYAPHAPHQQSPQHTGGSSSSASYPAQQQPYQQQPQHTGGSGSSASSYGPSQAPRPSSYPDQAYSPPAQGQAPYGGASGPGPGLGRGTSLSARPTPAMYPGTASPPQGHSPRPDPAPRPATAAGYASYSAGGGPGGAYPASPPPHGGSTHPSSPPPHGGSSYPGSPPPHAGGSTYPGSPPPHGGPPPVHHASLAPRPDSVRPTTPGYGGPPRPGPGPMGPPQQTLYSNQFPSNGPPASYPGSSYNPPGKLPSPEIPGPGFPPGPMASQYGAYNTPPPHQSPPFPGQTFPGPQQGYPTGPPPPGSPPYPPAGPSFPNAGGDNYFYQQPQPFPGGGYSPQPYNNYAPQPWVPGGGPPPLPHRPGSQPQPAYGQQPYGGPSFPSAAPSAPLGFGLDPLDKIVGRRTREQLEGAVDSLAQSSTKLLNKFR
ncbi:hypothetical protein DFH08DRAFT_969205 [Mycena albidolilacea]|uniref:Uncharacterized protein n=1 Tax=Mycena albidolilacea TaxID=1033008 RepID=A0AAD7EIH4_9AGAR|nr:hypothetical protein DFH08DRAFT_969205 [Mycena albidolilacea]